MHRRLCLACMMCSFRPSLVAAAPSCDTTVSAAVLLAGSHCCLLAGSKGQCSINCDWFAACIWLLRLPRCRASTAFSIIRQPLLPSLAAFRMRVCSPTPSSSSARSAARSPRVRRAPERLGQEPRCSDAASDGAAKRARLASDCAEADASDCAAVAEQAAVSPSSRRCAQARPLHELTVCNINAVHAQSTRFACIFSLDPALAHSFVSL